MVDYENKIGEYVSGNREQVTIDKEEYEELLNKVNNIGETYSKTNTITIAAKSTWTDVSNATWTIPAGTWVIDFDFCERDGLGTGIWTFQLPGFGITDSFWKSSGDYSTTHFTWVKTFEEETTTNFRYYQAISATSRNLTFTMNAIRIK